MMLVTGANGTTGSEITRQLVASGRPVRALMRRREAGAKLPHGVEIATGSFEDLPSLDAAMKGGGGGLSDLLRASRPVGPAGECDRSGPQGRCADDRAPLRFLRRARLSGSADPQSKDVGFSKYLILHGFIMFTRK